MPKILKFSELARAAVMAGVDKAANAVKATLGPKGRQVLLDRKYGTPLVTIDGVTVAREIELPNPFENMGAQLIKEICSRTNDVAGDGTTTAAVLAQAIVHEGFRNIAAGAEPMAVKRGVELAAKAVVAELKRTAHAIDIAGEKGRGEVTQIASISAADPEIGRLVADAVLKVGREGVVTVEEGKTAKTTIEIVEGMRFDQGYISPYFVTDVERMEAVLEEPYVLLTDKRIAMVEDLLPLLEKVIGSGKPLLVVAEDVEGEALAVLVVNKLQGRLHCVAVKAPGFGDRRKEMLDDIAVLTGGEMISDETGLTLEKGTLASLGRCRRVVAGKDDTTIVSGAGTPKSVQGRLAQVRRQIEKAEGDYDKEKLKERLAKLSGGVAVIQVGGTTETELKALKFKVEDAMHATQAGLEEGIVPGGGVALLRARAALDALKPADADERTGVAIVRRALEEPVRILAENAGTDGAIVADKVQSSADPRFGYDAEKDRYGDMMALGIVDPVKVTRSAVENAASLAGLLLTTEVLVADRPEKKPAAEPGNGEF